MTSSSANLEIAPSLGDPSPAFYSRWLATSRRFSARQPLGAACAVILILLCLTAVFANQIAPFSPTKNDVGPSLVGPSADHWFGTDQFGRDLFSRVVHGARVSLYVGIVATLLTSVISLVIGVVSGYLGGWPDYLIQRVVDTAQAIPPLIMLIAIVIVLGPSITNIIIALAVRGGISSSRVIRGVVLGVRGIPFIDAAQSLGATPFRIMLFHVLPNVFPTLLVLISVGIGGNIVAEASLSFLGYGVPPPTPSWGGMMSAEGRLYMLVNPWILVFPTLALAVVVYAMNMFGDALRDEIDPRMRGTR